MDAAGATDLLVVGDGGGRRTEVHDEPEVGLVESHAERGRRDEGLDPVAEQVRLEGLALGGVGLPGVGGDRVALLGSRPPGRGRRDTVSV